jgi:AcrR family transcriptional regulator
MSALPLTVRHGEVSADTHGARLMEGLAAAITEKGYAATTIADVVSRAHVSKRTFYEHFSDKEACLLALYAASNDLLLRVIADAADSGLPWKRRVEAAAHAYLSHLAAEPALTRTLLVEIQAAGPRALELRREEQQRVAELLRWLVDQGRHEVPELRPLSEAMATAVVGGINELILAAVERGKAKRLGELTGTVTELIQAVLTAPAD